MKSNFENSFNNTFVNPNIVFPIIQNQVQPLQSFTQEQTLYIGNISKTTDDKKLFDYFSKFGKLLMCRITKDLNQESRGFGYVAFNTIEQALKAKEALNHTTLDGKEIRICSKKTMTDFNNNANIFIKNLDSNINSKQLEEICSQFGQIISCSIRFDNQGKSLGYAYVQYEDEESAHEAILNLKQNKLFSEKTEIESFVPMKNRNFEKKNVYIKNFPLSWEKQKIEEFIKSEFSKFGNITSQIVFEQTTESNVIRLFAFVAYDQDQSASSAISNLNGSLLDDSDNRLYVDYAQPKEIRKNALRKEKFTVNKTNLYIKNLKNDISEQKILDIFIEYGPITSILIKESKTANTKFAFINFQNEQDAMSVYQKGSNNLKILDLVKLPYPKASFICFAQSKDVRAQYIKTKKNTQLLIQNQISNPYQYQMAYNNPQVNSLTNQQIQNQGLHLNNQQLNQNQIQQDQYNALEQIDVLWLKKSEKVFNNFPIDKKKELLGNLMFVKVSEKIKDVNLVPKITGMLIDFDILSLKEMIEILEDPVCLQERIQEAIEIIKEEEQEELIKNNQFII